MCGRGISYNRTPVVGYPGFQLREWPSNCLATLARQSKARVGNFFLQIKLFLLRHIQFKYSQNYSRCVRPPFQPRGLLILGLLVHVGIGTGNESP